MCYVQFGSQLPLGAIPRGLHVLLEPWRYIVQDLVAYDYDLVAYD